MAECMMLPNWLTASGPLIDSVKGHRTVNYSSRDGRTHIYALIDPRTETIRYVGKSTRPSERLTNHMNEKSNCHRSHWFQELKRIHTMPQLVILETVAPGSSWQDAEKWWISCLRAAGINLTNNTAGGDGVTDLPEATRAKMRLVWLGRKHSPETIQKLCEARRKRVTSPETRLKHSKSMRGRKITWIAKIAEINRKLSPESVTLILGRINAGEKVKDLAVEYSVHRTTLSKIKTGRYLTFGQHN